MTTQKMLSVMRKGITKYKMIKDGDKIAVGVSGGKDSVTLLKLDEPVEVFNFEVEDCHTYFVGNLLTLVHNGHCSNPNGKKGGTAHQNTIEREAQKLKAAGYKNISKENMIRTPGGQKTKRFTDLMGTRGNRSLHIQVGKATGSGLPVARERRAIADLLKAGIDVIFVPYNG